MIAAATELTYRQHIRQLVDEAPPVTPEQLDRIGAILKTSNGGSVRRLADHYRAAEEA